MSRSGPSPSGVPLGPQVDPLSPTLAGELAPFVEALRRGGDFRPVLEELLLALPLERAERLMLLLREGRAAWIPLLEGAGGRALFVGNALSGSVVALALAGFRPTVIDRSRERLDFAAERCSRASGVELQTLVVGNEPRLAFEDARFDLVVREPGPDAWSSGPSLRELVRVSRSELALVAENRLGYKQSAGRQGVFRIPSPARYLARALRPPPGVRTLRGHRAALASAGCRSIRAFALYPHAQDFAQVAALDRELPLLHVGPKERRNPWKLWGKRLGLFPLLAPSFALLGSTRSSAAMRTRLERILDALAERLDEAPLEAEVLVATRGHTALVLTRARARAEEGGESGGRLCIHIPLSPQRRVLAERHFRALLHIRERARRVPIPLPRFAGEIEGLYLCCEQRLEGLGAPQISGQPELTDRMLADAARHLAELGLGPAQQLDESGFERLLGTRFDTAASHAGVASTVAALRAMRQEARARLVGRRLPRVLCHGDLRGKHVQVAADGSVLGFLDWGTWEAEGPPLYDLMHLIVHERRQAEGLSAERAWRIASSPESLRAGERHALSEYARRLGLDRETCSALAALYPALVGAMAESTWDYSRPRWLQRNFGLGSSVLGAGEAALT